MLNTFSHKVLLWVIPKSTIFRFRSLFIYFRINTSRITKAALSCYYLNYRLISRFLFFFLLSNTLLYFRNSNIFYFLSKPFRRTESTIRNQQLSYLRISNSLSSQSYHWEPQVQRVLVFRINLNPLSTPPSVPFLGRGFHFHKTTLIQQLLTILESYPKTHFCSSGPNTH